MKSQEKKKLFKISNKIIARKNLNISIFFIFYFRSLTIFLRLVSCKMAIKEFCSPFFIVFEMEILKMLILQVPLFQINNYQLSSLKLNTLRSSG
ncbi:hypothetical protein DCO56_11890 [Sphingobacterium athyrii]|uniref:Uncharacterized protein n=1 Tax=Sphingobacterium athyrii TaxID=2152717 RepID=A0A363NTI5_9SPHI|nr:hypothetical protein DCO56_11890 [Sphingobacterium athyrii]